MGKHTSIMHCPAWLGSSTIFYTRRAPRQHGFVSGCKQWSTDISESS